MSRTLLYRLLWIPSALAIAGMTYAFATQPVAAPTPAPMLRYTTGDRSLRIKHPGNWKAHERSSHAVETEIEFEPSRNARMVIKADLQGSLMAGIMTSTDTQVGQMAGMIPGAEALAGPRKSPLERMHEFQGAIMRKNRSEYPGYVDGKAVPVRIGGRDGLASDCSWTAPGLFGNQSIVGRRVTVLAGDHEVTVVFGCRKEVESTLLPVFTKMLDTLEIDPQGGSQ